MRVPFEGAGQERESHRCRAFRRRPFALVLTLAFFAMLCVPALARNAYVANEFSNTVSVIDTAANAVVGSPIPVGTHPYGIAISPDGSRAYVTNEDLTSNSVSVIDTGTNSTVGSPIPAGETPRALAITPDGSRAYVANYGSANLSVIDTSTNTTVGSPIPAGNGPIGIAITPDGSRAYVTNFGVNGTVTVIDTATSTTVGSPIPLAGGPQGIAIAPNGSRAYVTRAYQDNVAIIDTSTNTVVGPLIPVGDVPQAIAITPDGSRAYVANSNSNNVSVIDTATSTTVGSPIPVGTYPVAIAITPDGSRAYVANQDSNSVSVIDTATNVTVGGTIPVGEGPPGLAIVPGQGPTAAFAATPQGADSVAQRARHLDRVRGAPLRQVDFNGGGSSDPDGNVARFAWDFGDGTTLPDGGPTPTHTYPGDGTYTATLTVTDNEGCSATRVFTGQTMSCNGGARARAEQTISFDLTGPKLKLSGKRDQPRDAAVEVRARTNEAATATATGTLLIEPGKGGNRAELKVERYKLKKTSKPLAAGKRKTLKLKLPRKADRAGKRALRDGAEITARITVTVTDAAGNVSKKKRRVELV